MSAGFEAGREGFASRLLSCQGCNRLEDVKDPDPGHESQVGSTHANF